MPNRHHPFNRYAPFWSLTSLVVVCGVPEALAEGWWLEAGPAVRGGMSVKVGGSSYTQQLGLHEPAASGTLAAPSGIGSPTVYGDRVYDNGYVKLDPGTGNSMPPNDPNTTWNWGFNQPSQYDAGAQTLTYQKAGVPGYTSTVNRAMDAKDNLLGVGLQLRGGIGLIKSDKWSLDICAGFQGIWGASSKITTRQYQENVQQIVVTDTYDTAGIGGGSFPVNGFHGTYLGPFDNPPVIPSPTLPNLPQSRSIVNSGVLSTAQSDVAIEVRPDLYQFSLGPQLGFEASSRLKLSLRPTVALNVVDTSVSRGEVFGETTTGGTSSVIRTWSDHVNEMDVRFGLGVTAGVDLDLGKGFYAGIFGGYEWVTDKVDVTIGPNRVSFDGSGYSVGAVLGMRF